MEISRSKRARPVKRPEYPYAAWTPGGSLVVVCREGYAIIGTDNPRAKSHRHFGHFVEWFDDHYAYLENQLEPATEPVTIWNATMEEPISR